MHLRGKRFEYNIVKREAKNPADNVKSPHPTQVATETLLRVNTWCGITSGKSQHRHACVNENVGIPGRIGKRIRVTFMWQNEREPTEKLDASFGFALICVWSRD